MAIRTIDCPKDKTVRLEMDDHLSITGWDRDEIQIKIRDEGDLTVRQTGTEIFIEAEDDCVLTLPATVLVKIGSVNGSLSITSVNNEITIHDVGGHLTLRQVRQLSCEKVGGHLKIGHVEGDLTVQDVGGSVRGGIVNGVLKVANVGGAVKLMDVAVTGSMNVGGNIKMKLLALPGDFKVTAGSNIKLWLPEGIGYELEAVSGSQKIQLITNQETTRYSTGHQRMTVAGGGPLVQLVAGGNITVMDTGWEDDLSPEDLGIAGSSDFDAINERINMRVQERIRHAEESTRLAAERAEERAREASRRAEERLRAATANLGRDFVPQSPAWRPKVPGVTTAPAAPTPKKSTGEERLLILNLLSEKKISAAEANQLLDALDGKFHSSEG